jgi:hypothetical protein
VVVFTLTLKKIPIRGVFFLLLPWQEHLCATEGGNVPACCFVPDASIPDLCTSPDMSGRSFTADDTVASCAEEVSLELNRRESLYSFGKVEHCRIAAGRVG